MALAAYVVLFTAHVAWAWRCLGKPDELFHGPAVMVYHAAQAMRGESIYADWRGPSQVATVYGPLSYLLPGWIGRMAGAAPLDLYVIGRILSLLCTFGTGLTVYALARCLAARGKRGLAPSRARWARSKRACREVPVPFCHGLLVTDQSLALLAALATISSPVFWTIGGEFRAEPPAVFCSLLAVWWFVRFGSSRAWWVAGLFIGFAFLFKQSAVLPLLAIGLALWVGRRRRAAIGFTAAVVAGLAAIILLLNTATSGLYWLNAFHALAGNRTLSNLAIWPVSVLPVALAQYALAFVWLRRQRADRGLGVIEYYFLISLLVPFVMSWRDGAAEYYFCESVAAASILMTRLWHSWRGPSASGTLGRVTCDSPLTLNPFSRVACDAKTRGGRLRLVAVLLPAAVAVASLLQLQPSLPSRLREAVQARSLAAEERARWQDLVDRFDDLPQPVLCEIDSLTALGRHPPVMLDTWLFSGLIDRNVFDDGALRAELAQGRFGSIVLRLPLPTVRRYGSTTYVPRAWLDLIGQRYELAERLGEFHVYRPRTAGENR